MQRLRGLSKKLPQVNKGGNGSTSAPPKQFEPPKETPIEKITMEDLGESLKMCRVDKGGYLTTVPDEKVGHFYAGDSYVLFCKYKTVSNEVGLSVYIWHGFMSPLKTEDDAVHRAILASCSTPITIQVKITQGNEPLYFRSMFYQNCPPQIPTRNIIVHNGGSYSGKYDCVNYRIINQPYNIGANSLFQVSIQNNDMATAYVIARPKLTSSLNSQDCFILLNEGMALLWMGKDSTEEERAIAHYLAGLVSGDPLAVLKMIEGQNEMEEFWNALGGRGQYSSVRENSSQRITKTIEESELHVAEGWEWKSIGKDYSISSLVSSNILVLDVGFEGTFVWVGSEKNESTGMFYKAVECLDTIDAKDSETRPVIVVNQNFENALFQQSFKGFDSVSANVCDEEKEQKIDEEDTIEKNETTEVETIVTNEVAEETNETSIVDVNTGDRVKSIYGEGIVKEVRNDAVVIRMTSWELAGGQKPTAYLQSGHYEKIYVASVQVGDKVNSIYGEGVVKEIRAKEEVVIEMTTWELAGGQKPTAYLQKGHYEHVNESISIEVGDLVKSIYGEGVVVGVRTKGAVVIEMTSWELAGGQKPTAYLQQGHYEKSNGYSCVPDIKNVTCVAVGDMVKSIYGMGVVNEVRAGNEVVIEMTSWELAGGQKPTAFLQQGHYEKVTYSTNIEVGNMVKSIYGMGVVKEVRAGDEVVIEMTSWELAGGQKPTAYLQKGHYERASVDLEAGDRVKSIYGEGIVKEVRNDAVVIQMTSWELAGGQKPTAYLQSGHYEKIHVVSVQVGDNVKSIYGEGVVKELRAEEEVVIEMTTWELAGGQKPTAYLQKGHYELIIVKGEVANETVENQIKQFAAEAKSAEKAAEEEAAQLAAEEEAAEEEAEEEAAKKAAEEEAAAKKAAEEEAAAKKAAEEEAARLAAEEEAAKKAAEEEAAKKAAEEEAAKKAAEEAAAKKAAEEEAARLAAEEEAAKKAAEEEAAAKKAAEEEAAKKAKKAVEEEASKKAAEEEAAAKKAAEEEAVRLAAEEEAARLAAEEEAAKKAAEEEASKKAAEEAAKQAAEVAEAKKKEEVTVEGEVTSSVVEEEKKSSEDDVQNTENDENTTCKTGAKSQSLNHETSETLETKKVDDELIQPPQESYTKQEKETNSDETTYYTLDELKKPIDGVEWAKRENYLSDEEFMKHFSMDKKAFAAMAKWKQQAAKKKLGIF